jgi:transcription-repair coupling factor (superfamily II helicase)
MTLQELVQLYAMAPAIKAIRKTIEDSSVHSVFLDGLVASSSPMLFAAVACSQKMSGSSHLFILPDEEEAGYFYHDLKQIFGEKLRTGDSGDSSQDHVLFFPSSYRRAIKFAQRDSANEILRTEVLAQLSSSASHLFLVTYPSAIAEQVISKQQLSEHTLVLRQGQTIEIDDVVKTLRGFGFHEVDYVYEPGQFAQRGSILDVFSYSCEFPFRIDFFGDDIETIRTFEVSDQLSRDIKLEISIIPELGLTQEEVRWSSFLSFLKKDTIVVAKDILFVRDAIERTCQEANEEETRVISGAQFMDEIAAFRLIEFGHRPSSKSDASLAFHTSPQPLLHKNFDLLRQSFTDYQAEGYHIYILADSQKQLQRLRDILQNTEKQLQTVNYVDSTLHAGFVDHDQRLCVFTDHEIFDRFHKYSLRSDKARSGKAALTLKEIQQFEIGDYVVHVDHGIGKFGGLVRMPIANNLQTTGSGQRYQEMIKIIYQGGGAIYVSIHSLYKVSKYKAQDNGEQPRLSQLGTGQWERLKERTKNKLKDIARDLIKLYAARKREKGFAFSADTFMQQELEASFLYEDTPDQLKVTNDVKADMEQARPMDRLVCGDVGFGKTEVAVRAAFKAACDSKQVAVLVPTTVLAYQHFQTFKNRLKNLPVRVDYLTRARTAKQPREIL